MTRKQPRSRLLRACTCSPGPDALGEKTLTRAACSGVWMCPFRWPYNANIAYWVWDTIFAF